MGKGAQEFKDFFEARTMRLKENIRKRMRQPLKNTSMGDLLRLLLPPTDVSWGVSSSVADKLVE